MAKKQAKTKDEEEKEKEVPAHRTTRPQTPIDPPANPPRSEFNRPHGTR